MHTIYWSNENKNAKQLKAYVVQEEKGRVILAHVMFSVTVTDYHPLLFFVSWFTVFYRQHIRYNNKQIQQNNQIACNVYTVFTREK